MSKFWKVSALVVVVGIGGWVYFASSDPQRWYGTECKILWRNAGLHAPLLYEAQWHKVNDSEYLIRVRLEDEMGFPIDPGMCEFNFEKKSMTLFEPPA